MAPCWIKNWFFFSGKAYISAKPHENGRVGWGAGIVLKSGISSAKRPLLCLTLSHTVIVLWMFAI